MININGNLVQIAGTGQSTTANSSTVTQAVNSAASTVVPQATTLAASSVTTTANQIGVANGNIVMVRNNTDVRNSH